MNEQKPNPAIRQQRVRDAARLVGLTDGGLQYVSKMTTLEWLGLSETEIGDDGLEHLSELTNLRWLEVDNTHVTDAGAARLQMHLSGCKIVTTSSLQR